MLYAYVDRLPISGPQSKACPSGYPPAAQHLDPLAHSLTDAHPSCLRPLSRRTWVHFSEPGRPAEISRRLALAQLMEAGYSKVRTQRSGDAVTLKATVLR